MTKVEKLWLALFLILRWDEIDDEDTKEDHDVEAEFDNDVGSPLTRKPLPSFPQLCDDEGKNSNADRRQQIWWTTHQLCLEERRSWSGILSSSFVTSLTAFWSKKDDYLWIAYLRRSQIYLTEPPFQDLMMLVSGCGGGFWTTMEPNSHRLPVWPPWMSCCRCWCFLPWCTLYTLYA